MAADEREATSWFRVAAAAGFVAVQYLGLLLAMKGSPVEQECPSRRYEGMNSVVELGGT